MKLLRGLMLSSGPMHLRELASDYSLSPAGVSDLLRRLKKLGVIREKKLGNRRGIFLNFSPHEQEGLRNFFAAIEKDFIMQRARRFDRNAMEKFEWMDEAYEFYRGLKAKSHDPT